MSKTPSSTFESVFLGEHVSILTRVMSTVIQTQEDGMVTEFTSPMSYSGFFVDLDSDFVYLGDTADCAVQAVAKKLILSIQVADVKKDKIDERLDALKTDISH